MKWFIILFYAVINFSLASGDTSRVPYVQIVFIVLSTAMYVFCSLKYGSISNVIDLDDIVKNATINMHVLLTGLYLMTVFRMIVDIGYYVHEAPIWMAVVCLLCLFVFAVSFYFATLRRAKT